MAFVCRSDKELKKLGHSVVVTRAIEALGGAGDGCKKLGLSNPQTVKMWMRAERRIPTKYINPICKLGGNQFTAQQILDEMDKWKIDN